MRAGNDAGPIEMPRQGPMQNVLDERRLSRPRYAGHGDENA